MINEYGYIFEGLNGYDPGVVVNFTNKDSVSNVFEVQDDIWYVTEPVQKKADYARLRAMFLQFRKELQIEWRKELR